MIHHRNPLLVSYRMYDLEEGRRPIIHSLRPNTFAYGLRSEGR